MICAFFAIHIAIHIETLLLLFALQFAVPCIAMQSHSRTKDFRTQTAKREFMDFRFLWNVFPSTRNFSRRQFELANFIWNLYTLRRANQFVFPNLASIASRLFTSNSGWNSVEKWEVRKLSERAKKKHHFLRVIIMRNVRKIWFYCCPKLANKPKRNGHKSQETLNSNCSLTHTTARSCFTETWHGLAWNGMNGAEAGATFWLSSI